jgi:hypothetical protein
MAPGGDDCRTGHVPDLPRKGRARTSAQSECRAEAWPSPLLKISLHGCAPLEAHRSLADHVDGAGPARSLRSSSTKPAMGARHGSCSPTSRSRPSNTETSPPAAGLASSTESKPSPPPEPPSTRRCRPACPAGRHSISGHETPEHPAQRRTFRRLERERWPFATRMFGRVARVPCGPIDPIPYVGQPRRSTRI